MSQDIRDLIRTMSLANPRWGAPRIHGELGNCSSSVSKYPRPPWPSTWFVGENRLLKPGVHS